MQKLAFSKLVPHQTLYLDLRFWSYVKSQMCVRMCIVLWMLTV